MQCSSTRSAVREAGPQVADEDLVRRVRDCVREAAALPVDRPRERSQPRLLTPGPFMVEQVELTEHAFEVQVLKKQIAVPENRG